jgi:hypothetical protein
VQVRLPPFLALPLQVVVQLRLDCAKAGANMSMTNRQMIASNRAFIGPPRIFVREKDHTLTLAGCKRT